MKTLQSGPLDCKMAILVLMAWMVGAGGVQAQCANASIDSLSSGTSKSKCGYPELCDTSSPPKRFLQSISIDSTAMSYTFVNDVSHFVENVSGHTAETVGTLYNPLVDCTTYSTTPCSGSGNVSYHLSWPGAGDYSYSGSASEASDCSGLNYSDDWPNYNGYLWGIWGGISGYLNPSTEKTTTTCTSTMSISTTSDHGGDGNGTTYQITEISGTLLAKEYTDAMLRANLIATLPAYPAAWATNCSSSAYYHLDSSHLTANGGKMKYRIHLTNCQPDPDVTYRVHWDQTTTYDDPGTPPSVEHLQETIQGSADPANGSYGTVHEVGVPSARCTITEAVQNPPEVISPGP